jgi:hypothetical protein
MYMAICEYEDIPPDFATYVIEYEGKEFPYDEQQAIGGITTGGAVTDNTNTSVTEKNNLQYLQNTAFMHRLTGEDVYKKIPDEAPSLFMMEDRYTRQVYQGILPDSGAANTSTVGKEQYQALQREDPSVQLDESTAGQVSVKFGHGEQFFSIGTVTIRTPIGSIVFHVLNTPTPFLMCLADMDRLGVYYDNTTDELVQGDKRYPVTRKWGHAWFHLSKEDTTQTFLTEVELRRLHRRFGHPSVERLYKLLNRAGHETRSEDLRAIEELCHHCQVNSQAPRRFKFTLKEDQEFNYEVVVDVMHLSGKSVLHVVDYATSFGAAGFLPSNSAKDTWELLRMLWIDT